MGNARMLPHYVYAVKTEETLVKTKRHCSYHNRDERR